MPFNTSSTWRPKPEERDPAQLEAEYQATSAAAEQAKSELAAIEAVKALLLAQRRRRAGK